MALARAERPCVRRVRGLAAGHQLEDEQPLLRHREVEAGRLADDRHRGAKTATRELRDDLAPCRRSSSPRHAPASARRDTAAPRPRPRERPRSSRRPRPWRRWRRGRRLCRPTSRPRRPWIACPARSRRHGVEMGVRRPPAVRPPHLPLPSPFASRPRDCRRRGRPPLRGARETRQRNSTIALSSPETDGVETSSRWSASIAARSSLTRPLTGWNSGAAASAGIEGTTSVPIPSLVKSSASSASGVANGTRWTRGTPPSRARTIAFDFGSMPPVSEPRASSPASPARSTSETSDAGSSARSRSPGTATAKRSFSAPRATASSAATVSALTFRRAPWSSAASGATTGT